MKNETYISPFGVAMYPKLTTPDDRFNPDNPVYEVTLRLPMQEEGVEEFLEQLDKMHKDAVAAAQEEHGAIKESAHPVKIDDQEALVKFKMKSIGRSRATGKTWDQRPALFGADRRPLDEGVDIGGGSVIRVAFHAFPYYTPSVGAGVSLKLKSVQVRELKTWDGCDFDAVEEEGAVVEASSDFGDDY